MAVSIIVVTPVYVAVEHAYRMMLVELVVRTHRPTRFLIGEARQGVVQFARCERRETTLADVVFRFQARAQHMFVRRFNQFVRFCRAIVTIPFGYSLFRAVGVLVAFAKGESKAVPRELPVREKEALCRGCQYSETMLPFLVIRLSTCLWMYLYSADIFSHFHGL